MIDQIQFIHFLTATAIIELFMLYLFKFTNQSSIVINNWYNNLGWSAIILDVLSILIGFYIAKFIFQYLRENNYLSKKNELFKYLVILLIVQILHDILFYYFVIRPTPKNINKVIDEFKEYAKYYQSQAIFADSLIYLSITPLLYYYISKQSNQMNTFTTIVCFYLLSYLLHQKAKIN
tara:strand:+ start:26616 stop:27149 length:534 start_codon:yes stop_codon:yes gene_type:complete